MFAGGHRVEQRVEEIVLHERRHRAARRNECCADAPRGRRRPRRRRRRRRRARTAAWLRPAQSAPAIGAATTAYLYPDAPGRAVGDRRRRSRRTPPRDATRPARRRQRAHRKRRELDGVAIGGSDNRHAIVALPRVNRDGGDVCRQWLAARGHTSATPRGTAAAAPPLPDQPRRRARGDDGDAASSAAAACSADGSGTVALATAAGSWSVGAVCSGSLGCARSAPSDSDKLGPRRIVEQHDGRRRRWRQRRALAAREEWTRRTRCRRRLRAARRTPTLYERA